MKQPPFLSLIAALGENRVIGTERGLPWHLPRDLKRFRELTWGKPLILGRKTMETLGAPLKGRPHIVLTHQASLPFEGIHLVHDVREALLVAQNLATELGCQESMVIGGEQIYRLFLPYIQRMYLTIVQGSFPGSAFFPEYLPGGQHWQVVRSEFVPADDRNPHAHRFVVLEPSEGTRRRAEGRGPRWGG
jgi:dihydrofolate reductase